MNSSLRKLSRRLSIQFLKLPHLSAPHTFTIMSEPLFVTKEGKEYTEPMLFVQLMQRVTKLEESVALHNKVMRQILQSLDKQQSEQHYDREIFWIKTGRH